MNNKTFIYVLTDRSGSMREIRDDVIGGFNTFVESQKEVEGECLMTYAQFDHEYEEVFKNKNIQDVEYLTHETFLPRGRTALLDAWGRSIVSLKEFIATLPTEEKPGKVIFVVITDGEENASVEFKSKSQIATMVSEMKEKEDWEFTFLAANQDAIAEGRLLGVQSSLSFSARSKGVKEIYKTLTKSITNYRTGASQSLDYSDQDRKAALSDDDDD